jgi:hypothetical protein
MSKNSLGMIPYWDMKAKSFRLYVNKIQAYTKFIGVGDKLNRFDDEIPNSVGV